MRAAVPGLPSPHPLTERLPAVFQEDEFTLRFVSAFDDLLAPVFATLDCFDAYLDPSLAPPDLLAWLATWVALDLDEPGRDLVRHAVTLHRWRGTRRGLVERVRLLTGGEVEVADTGGCSWSNEPGTPIRGEDPPRVDVTVRASGPVDLPRLRAAVAAAVPAHVTTTVEVERA
jgi:phage tail-like protein